MDFINKCIWRKPANRLGLNGPDEVKAHPWFANYDWERLYRKEIVAPFKPAVADNFDESYTNQDWKDATSEAMLQ